MAHKKVPKKHPVNLKFDDEEYEKLTKLADADHRSRVNYLMNLIRRHLLERAIPENEK